MKNLFSSTSLLLLGIVTLCSCTPNPKNILEGSYIKCQSVYNGYYEMEHYWKLMSSNDTVKVSQSCYFKKTDNDSILPFVFNAKSAPSVVLFPVNTLYTGKQFVSYSEDGSRVGAIYSHPNIIWTLLVKNLALNSYLPITYKDSRPITSDIVSDSPRGSISFIKEELINGIECYHIQAIVPPEYDHSTLKKYEYIIKTEFNYWINKHDSIPIQLTIARDLKVGNELLVEFEKYVLTKYELNYKIDSTLFTMKSIPEDIDLRYFERLETGKPLETGDIAPNWNLVSSNGEMVDLSDYRGELVLIDFFFAGCPPCIEMLPGLTSLYEKYRNQGLQIIGISNTDTKKTLEYFKERHGINYPLLIGNHDVGNSYNITEVPALFLIDQKGILLHPKFNDESLEKLENIIRQHVKQE
jgi:peroxiredoxin